MDPDINFKRDFPLLDKILHWVSPLLVGYVVFLAIFVFQSLISRFFGIPQVRFSPDALDSFPLLAHFNPMWIPAIFVAVVVVILNKRRQSIKLNRYKNHNIPAMFYDETPAIQPQVERSEETQDDNAKTT